MKKGSQVAVALGAGYLLGRRRKMRLAMMLAGAAAVGGTGGVAGQLARRGAKVVGSSLGSADLLGKVSPELSELTGLIRHDLLDAGKGAAKTAMNSQIDSLSDRLHERAEAWRNPAEAASGTARGATDTARGAADTARGAISGGRGEPEEGEEPEDEPRDEEAPEAPPRRRRSTRPASGGRSDDDGSRPARRATRTARSAASASPVRRAGR